MSDISNAELVAAAEAALHPQDVGEFWVADVACALVTQDGRSFTGACTGGSLGLCAEQGAASAMVSSGHVEISRIVAVWRSPTDELHALPPCGRCREFLRTLSQADVEAAVVLGLDHVVRLRDLLPWHGWRSELLWPSRRP